MADRVAGKSERSPKTMGMTGNQKIGRNTDEEGDLKKGGGSSRKKKKKQHKRKRKKNRKGLLEGNRKRSVGGRKMMLDRK